MRRFLIPGIFLLSGAAGLIFEVVWSRQLVLVFGNTTQAVSAILTGYFGGMALGSWYGGKLADHSRRPLRLYGLLEVSLVGVVLLTPLSFRLIHEVYRSAFGALESSPATLSLVRFGLALLALAPATVLMGATLPTLTRYLAREAEGLSAAFSRLYVANTMGAVFGAAAAGLVLIEILGLSGSLLVGAACSGTAGVIAIGLDTLWSSDESPNGSFVTPGGKPATRASDFSLALFVAFISGLTSLGYQVIWMRLLASGTGSSTYVFTIILTLFLVGLSFGAVEYKRIGARLRDVIPILAGGQILLALLAVLGMYLINALDYLHGAFLWKALAVVLPATFVMGFSFPASAALLGGSDAEVGSRSGLLLAANTSGAIVGTFVIPFLLIPLIGSPSALGLIAVTNAATGILLALRAGRSSPRFRTALIAFGGIAAVVVVVSVVSPSVFVDPGVARMRRKGAELYHSREDEIASVQTGSFAGQKRLWVTGFSMTLLTVDAKLMPILPLILRPASKCILVVAFGMGSTFRASLIAGLRADAVELVPSVPRVFGAFYPDARAVLADPAGRVLIADGRSHVDLTDKRYDIIVVDPPPPLESAGVSVISSLEFYAASKNRLTDGGVMMQWVPWGQTLDDFKAHLRTFRHVFPHVIVAAGPGGSGFYMLGSADAIEFNEVALRETLSRPGVAADLSSAYDSPENTVDGWAALIPTLIRLQGDEVLNFTGAGPLITDDRPLPEYFLLKITFGPSNEWLDPEKIRAIGK